MISEAPDQGPAAVPPTPSPDAVPAPRPRGRPSLYTPQATTAVCTLLRLFGGSIARAAALAGLNGKTVLRWRQQYPDFAEDLEAARSEFLAFQLLKVGHAKDLQGRKDWRAAAWLLERTFPEEYGRRLLPAEALPEPRSPGGTD